MTVPYYDNGPVRLYQSDARYLPVAGESVDCVVTSPPYWGLRDYGVTGQIGDEATHGEYVAHMVEVFREVWRVLKPEGTLWLNLGDSYAGSGKGPSVRPEQHMPGATRKPPPGIKPKDLVGIPWRVAFALQDDGWWLRSDIIWSKPNPMPESVTDRPTRAHEYLFLLTKSARYHYDSDAIREPAEWARWGKQTVVKGTPGTGSWIGQRSKEELHERARATDKQRGHGRRHAGFNDRWDAMTREEQWAMGRNKRDVWEIATRPYAEAHFATFPEALVDPCILAGCPVGGLVLDPFIGSGTVAAVAQRLGRRAVGVDLNEAYLQLASKRVGQVSLAMKL